MKFELSLLSLKQCVFLSFPGKELSYAFAEALDHKIEQECQMLIIEPWQRNTAELRERVGGFLDAHGGGNPKIKKMINYLSLLPDGHFFLVVEGKVEDTHQIMHYLPCLPKSIAKTISPPRWRL